MDGIDASIIAIAIKDGDVGKHYDELIGLGLSPATIRGKVERARQKLAVAQAPTTNMQSAAAPAA